MNEDFEVISENLPKTLIPLIECFKSGMNNLNKSYK